MKELEKNNFSNNSPSIKNNLIIFNKGEYYHVLFNL